MPTPGLSKNIRVPLITGKDYSIQELHSMVLASKINGKKLYTYAIDDFGDVEVAEITDSIKGNKEEIWRLVLQSGERFEGMIASEVLIRIDDEWSQVSLRNHGFETEICSKLKSGDKLYPLGRGVDKDGYEILAQHTSLDVVSTHWLSDNYNVRQETATDNPSDLWHRRHKDGDKRNNDPENIIRLTPTEANIQMPKTAHYGKPRTNEKPKSGTVSNTYRNKHDLASMVSRLTDAEPNYYEHDNREYESRERWKRKHREDEKGPKELFNIQAIVSFTELMTEIIDEKEEPIEEIVYTLVTDLGNFAILPNAGGSLGTPGVFVLC